MIEPPATDCKRDWALWYAGEHGWPVFPVWWIADGKCACNEPDCDSPAKHPNSFWAPNGCNSATTDLDRIDEIWTASPNSNIGMLTTHHPVVDLDTDEARNIARAKLSSDLAKLLPVAETGRGGRHLHFDKQDGIYSKNETGCKGFDVKADGGYVVLPPSANAAGPYKWLQLPNGELPEMPDALVEYIQGNQKGKEQANGNLRLSDYGNEKLATHPGSSKGRRNQDLCRLAGKELKLGIDPEEVYRQAVAWGTRCSPEYSEKEVHRTVAVLAAKEAKQAKAPPSQEQQSIFAIEGLGMIDTPPVEWLWPEWMPQGALVFLNGNPDAGKTWLACQLTACITRGKFWPDRKGMAPKGRVLFASAEDHLSVLKERLAKLGADLDLVMIPRCGEHKDETALLLHKYVPELEAALTAHPDILMIVIDTLSAMLPIVNFDKLEQVQHGCQGSQAAGRPVQRDNPWIAPHPQEHDRPRIDPCGQRFCWLGRGARAAMLLVLDPNDEKRRLLLCQKNNWSLKPMARAYGIEDGTMVWEPDPVKVNWADLQAPPSRAEKAVEWLEDYLKDGPRPAIQLTIDARKAGIAEKTLRRAKKLLKVESEKEGPTGPWFWKLPPEDGQDGQDDHQEKLFLEDGQDGQKSHANFGGQLQDGQEDGL